MYVRYYVHTLVNINFMSAKTILSISEARKKIFQIANEVQKPGIHFIFTENGSPKAVLVSATEYDSLMETIDILSNPKALPRIKKAKDEFEKGELVSWDVAKNFLGWQKPLASMVMDKSKKQYSAKVKKQK